jgi:glycerol-3-phosphate dehydrogenase (NAD(P)+)
VQARARVLGVEVPIVDAVVEVIDGQLAPREALQALMRREAKAEAGT